MAHSFRYHDWDEPEAEPLAWAVRFERKVRDLLEIGKEDQFVDYQAMGPDAMVSIPTPDHYLPLLCIAGSRRRGESVSFEGFDGGSMSMIAVQLCGD